MGRKRSGRTSNVCTGVFRTSRKPLILGCGPCVKAIPELGELSRAFQQELAVVSINLDKESIWKPVSKRHGIFWNDWNDPKGTAGSLRSYGSEAIPVFVLVSADGIIQRIKVGYARGWLRDMVEEVLK